MSAFQAFATLIIATTSASMSQWISQSTPVLPRADQNMAIGYYNQTVFLLYALLSISSFSVHNTIIPIVLNVVIPRLFVLISGGYNYRQQLTTYDIGTNSFTDYGSSYLYDTLSSGNLFKEMGLATYYTQINETTLFSIAQSTTRISVYDLESLSWQQLATNIPTNVYFRGCLASSQSPSALYITGGWYTSTTSSTMNDLQVLTLHDMTWSDNAPAMTYARHSHGCVVVDDRLWAIGFVLAVEAINITGLESQSWNEMMTLPQRLVQFGMVAVDDTIYIVGGYNISSFAMNSVIAIDTAAASYAMYDGVLPYAVYGMPVVLIDDTIYGFGGTDGMSSDSWMTVDMLSIQ